jgi:isopenicillin N synthase-like dioxygenase
VLAALAIMTSNFTKIGVTAAVAVTAVAAYMYWNSSSSDKKKDSAKNDDAPLSLPVVEFSAFFDKEKDPARYEAECAKVAHALHHFGLVILRDPRVAESDNNRFIDMMERYFTSSDGLRDARPEYGYQVGVTKDFVELPRNHCKTMGAYGPDNKPLSPCPPELDPKWRFFWRTGPQPEKTEFPLENMDPVIPVEFPEWKEVMDSWGGQMTTALYTLAEMAAVGFKMPADTFTSRMMYGPHLLAPTGSDFSKHGKEGTVLAGFHYDLNFLTIHGKSRFPGLYVWTRQGARTAVSVPDGCLIVQAGKQIEYLTGGHVLAGFHEVVVNKATRRVIEAKQQKGESLWRVSSTCFGHIASDQTLEPLAPFDSAEAKSKFPPIKTGKQVVEELKVIALHK